jgi:hypothetical protein
MDAKTIEDMRYFADRHRGKHKTSGPHWSTINRFPLLFDEMMRLRSVLEQIDYGAEHGRNLDWCRRKAKEGLEQNTSTSGLDK